MSGRPGDNPDYDRHNESECEPEMEDMLDDDWLTKWELERGITPNLPDRQQQFIVSMAMDAFRLCIGKAPRNHDSENVVRWIRSSVATCVSPIPPHTEG